MRDEEQDKVMLLSAAFFAVRLFRGLGTFGAGVPDYNAIRAVAAEQSVLDAKALLEAAKKAQLT